MLSALLWFFKAMKGGKNGPENIITSYYQITVVFKPMLSIRQHAVSKDEMK